MSKIARYAAVHIPLSWRRSVSDATQTLTCSYSKQDWADDFADDDAASLPAQTVTSNRDGTKTVVSYRFNDDGKRVKV